VIVRKANDHAVEGPRGSDLTMPPQEIFAWQPRENALLHSS